MWTYEKKLQYPVKIKNPNPAYAKIILTQLGGPDGEMGATARYMNQRYTMPYAAGKAILTDIATEELDQSRYIEKKGSGKHPEPFSFALSRSIYLRSLSYNQDNPLSTGSKVWLISP